MRKAAVVSLLTLGCMLSACSSSSSSPATTGAAVTTTSAAAVTTTTASGPTPFYEVKLGKVPGLGEVLVAGNGFTLYMFVPDKQSGTSTCYGPCAQAWPPLDLPTGVTKPVAGAGVNASLLTTTKRTDGTTELVYNGWPLYLWAGDSTPGQATGQAINNNGGLWYVLNAAGRVITTKP